MRDFLLGAFILLTMTAGSYSLGFRRATEQHQLEATLAAQALKDAVSRASDGLYEVAKTVTADEKIDDQKLREIVDAAKAAPDTCAVPADRLRILDKIQN